MNATEIINAQQEIRKMAGSLSYNELQLLLDKSFILRQEISIEMTKRDAQNKKDIKFKWGGFCTAKEFLNMEFTRDAMGLNK